MQMKCTNKKWEFAVKRLVWCYYLEMNTQLHNKLILYLCWTEFFFDYYDSDYSINLTENNASKIINNLKKLLNYFSISTVHITLI